MSRDPRKGYYRDRDWNNPHYNRSRTMRKRSRTPPSRSDADKRRSRSPRKNDKDLLDENILSEIAKLPEPSELWDSQFQEGSFTAPPPPSFQEGVANPNFTAQASYQPPMYPGIYDDFPPVASMPQAPQPPDMQSSWNQMSLPPPPLAAAPPPAPFVSNEDQIKKEAAIESEMRHQKAALSKQREDYMKKANILKKELDTLKDQRNELRGDAKRSPSPDTKRFLKENTKLQLEIQNKLKTIYNVVDMLNGIIGEEAPELPESDEPAERSSAKRKSRSPSAGKKFNYVYYDPEMHWCRVCNEFPPTAKDYLNHLHSPAHHKMAAAHMEAPWHSVAGAHEGFPSFPAAPTKRTPIKGLQFFVPSTAWYCKLCDQFIGDLHCASAHLKSITHSKNYTNFVEQNPHWETDWMSDRQKAVEKSRANKPKTEAEKPQQYAAHTITFNKDGFHTKRKESPPPSADDKKKKKEKKKKKKHSSSSSSSSSSSDSDSAKKKKKKWMSGAHSDRLNENDRKLLETLKNRMKTDKADEDKRRSTDRARERETAAEILRKIRESERRGESERRDSRSRDPRERERERERDRRSQSRADSKKPEVKKMPFIGKMPVYKHLNKTTKIEEQKKDEEKKKDDEECSKKRREEIDAEIQKKVAEFKEKIGRAQLERQQQVERLQHIELPPPAVVIPTHLAAPPPAPPPPSAAPAPAPYNIAPPLPLPTPAMPPLPNPGMPNTNMPNLPKDFQEALEIIFPSEVKKAAAELASQDQLFMPPGFNMPGLMPTPFSMPLMNPQMFGFDMNAPLFPRGPQLYDNHVPLLPAPKTRPKLNNKQNYNSKQNYNNKQNNRNTKNYSNKQQTKTQNSGTSTDTSAKAAATTKESKEVVKTMEKLDDLAMLGIDASDVSSGM